MKKYLVLVAESEKIASFCGCLSAHDEADPGGLGKDSSPIEACRELLERTEPGRTWLRNRSRREWIRQERMREYSIW